MRQTLREIHFGAPSTVSNEMKAVCSAWNMVTDRHDFPESFERWCKVGAERKEWIFLQAWRASKRHQ